MLSKNRCLCPVIVISLTATLFSSCADTQEEVSEDHSKVGMRLIGEASEAETSLSGDSVQTQPTVANSTSTTLSIPATTTTAPVESITVPKTTRPSTTTTTSLVETLDKPFYAATIRTNNRKFIGCPTSYPPALHSILIQVNDWRVNSSYMKVAITGASGFLGSHCVAKAVNKGHSVRILVRNTDKAHNALKMQGIKKDLVEIIYADLEDEDSLDRGLDGVDALLHTAAIFSLSPLDAKSMLNINPSSTKAHVHV